MYMYASTVGLEVGGGSQKKGRGGEYGSVHPTGTLPESFHAVEGTNSLTLPMQDRAGPYGRSLMTSQH